MSQDTNDNENNLVTLTKNTRISSKMFPHEKKLGYHLMAR